MDESVVKHRQQADLEERKRDHVALCAERDVECVSSSTLLDDVTFMHEALPEVDVEEIDLRADFLGHLLGLPLMITGMTGGHPGAIQINRALAALAQRHRLALGVGSQRPMLDANSPEAGYRLRDIAPDIFLAANIGAVQLRQSGASVVCDLAARIDANAICIHLNPAQELVQDQGDRRFRKCANAIAELVERSPLPIIVKETGCGISPRAARELAGAGVAALDVAGAGGTSWTRVESHRGSAAQRSLGETFADWGIPTAASIAFTTGRGPAVIASGGLRNGRDLAAGLALGADLGGMALPFLRAQQAGGQASLDRLVGSIAEALRAVCVLTGSRDLAALRRAPVHLGAALRDWLVLDDRSRAPVHTRSRLSEEPLGVRRARTRPFPVESLDSSQLE